MPKILKTCLHTFALRVIPIIYNLRSININNIACVV